MSSAPQSAPKTSFWNRLIPERLVIVGAILAGLAYCRDLQYDFILDDIALIVMNPRLSSWRHWKTILVTNIFPQSGPTTVSAVHYRPVYMFWMLLNQQLFGYVLPWWHLSSLLLHLAATLLVFKVGVKILRQEWTAALGALLFALHPIHVESVAYVTASTDVLVTVFLLLAVLAYYRFREGRSFAWLAISVVCSGLAMCSKENAVMLPFVIVACEWFGDFPKSETDSSGRRLLWSVPYFGVVAAYLVARTVLFGPNLGPGPGQSRIMASLHAPLVLLVYLRNLFWPVTLSFFYPDSWSNQWSIASTFALVMVLGLGAVLWLKQRPERGSRMLLAWTIILFVVPMGEVLTFATEGWVHDRQMYLVSVPLCLLIATAITNARLSRRAMMSVSSMLIAALLVLLVLQVPRFRDESSLYESALKVAPESVVGHEYYATALWMHGEREQAFREFRRVIELTPDDTLAYQSYASALQEAGRNKEALEVYRKALKLSPDNGRYRAYVLYRTGSLELDAGDVAEATALLQEAVSIDPKALNYHAELARALQATGHSEEAAEQTRMEAAVRAEAVRKRSGEAR